MTYSLQALRCLLLASVSLMVFAKPIENNQRVSQASQRSAKLHKWHDVKSPQHRQTDAKLSISQRSNPGAFAVEVSAQTNGFLHFPDAPPEHVRSRLIRSEASLSESSSPLDISAIPLAGTHSAGKEIHSHNAMQPEQAFGERVNSAAFIGEAFDVKIDSELSNDTSGENITAADNDWNTIARNAGVNITQENTTAAAQSGQNAGNSTGNTSTNVGENATASANHTEAKSTPEGNASSPPAPPPAPPANSTPEVNASSPPEPPAPAPAPANAAPQANASAAPPAAAAPAPPPVQIINKIVNKVNVTVHVTTNNKGKDGANGTSVKVDADSPSSQESTGNSSAQARADAQQKAEEKNKLPMDIWKSIVNSEDKSKTGGRNARVGDTSL